MKVLHLTLTARWFDMIAAGIKKEEYRELKEFWRVRLEGKEFDVICFRHGYRKDAREVWVQCLGIAEGFTRYEWSGVEAKRVYVIKLGDIVSKPVNLMPAELF